MIYVYPKLSKYDLYIIRIGGPGLGNLLFPFAEAISLAQKNNLKSIWPTWAQIKIGPLIRNEKDKRTYIGLFQGTEDYIKGVKKLILMLKGNKISRKELLNSDPGLLKRFEIEDTVVICSGMETLFSNFLMEHELIRTTLEKICRTKNNYEKSEFIGVHIRFGDFSKVSKEQLEKSIVNARLPVEWYFEKIMQLKDIMGEEIEVKVFSDARDDELKNVLSIKNTKRADYGTSINDILALSQAKVLIASNSTFSMWASYLGRMPVIWHKNQIKQRLYYGDDVGKEIELSVGEELPEIFKNYL